ncbi:helix-turn-helix domain-containing protein [bacterium AH-315-G11]|nr:helix-turn-helix domain-containing protein [bacterium AH-315-G11]
MNNIHSRIRFARKDVGLSQDTLAKKVGVVRATVTQWESGKAQPKGGRLSRVSNALHISVDWLLTGEGEKHSRIESSESFSPDEMALLQKYRQLGDDQKKATQTMVDAFNQPDEVRKVG